jgi:hypothetical protein
MVAAPLETCPLEADSTMALDHFLTGTHTTPLQIELPGLGLMTLTGFGSTTIGAIMGAASMGVTAANRQTMTMLRVTVCFIRTSWVAAWTTERMRNAELGRKAIQGVITA